MLDRIPVLLSYIPITTYHYSYVNEQADPLAETLRDIPDVGLIDYLTILCRPLASYPVILHLNEHYFMTGQILYSVALLLTTAILYRTCLAPLPY